jgi:hypothetical protein
MLALTGLFVLAVINQWKARHVYDKRFPFIFSMSWALGVPLYYWLSYLLFLYVHREIHQTEYQGEFEKLKYGQEVGRTLWLAVLGSMTAYFYGHRLFDRELKDE